MYKRQLQRPFATFAKAVAARLAPTVSPPNAADAPVEAPPLTPSEKVEHHVVPSAPARSPLPFVAGGAAVLSLAATTVFAVLGVVTQQQIVASRYDAGGLPATRFTQPELQSAASRADVFALAAVVSGVLTGTFGIVTALFMRSWP